MWHGTNMQMTLRSFRDCYKFHKKWINEVFRGFSMQHKWFQEPTQRYKPRRLSKERFGRKYDQARKCPKMSQKQLKLKVTIHAFRLSRARATDATLCLLGTWKVIGKESCGLERKCGCLYVHFKVNLGFTRNEQMGCLETFRGNSNGLKHPRNVTSYVNFPWNVSSENMTRAAKFQKCPRNSQNWRL